MSLYAILLATIDCNRVILSIISNGKVAPLLDSWFSTFAFAVRVYLFGTSVTSIVKIS